MDRVRSRLGRRSIDSGDLHKQVGAVMPETTVSDRDSSRWIDKAPGNSSPGAPHSLAHAM